MSDWDARYRAGEGAGRAPDPLLLRAIEGVPPGRALDLACGPGRHALALSSHGWQVTAVDRSPAAIEMLTRCAGNVVDARVADLERGGFTIEPDGWDLICDFLYLQRDLFPAIRAGVRPDGRFVAAMPMIDPRPDVKPMNPAFLVGPAELRSLFQDWEILHSAEYPREAPSRAVAELIARRR
ncbi:MAG: methyltransferase domain-containing protein [Bryobacteraceae bacterium]